MCWLIFIHIVFIFEWNPMEAKVRQLAQSEHFYLVLLLLLLESFELTYRYQENPPLQQST